MSTLLRTVSFSALGLALLVFAVSCSKSKVTCGEGTELDGSTCVPDDEGLGGAGGDGSGEQDPRAADVELLKKEFQGARAAGPSSDTSAVVVWDPVSVTDATFHVYVATTPDGFNFSRPQAVAPAGATSLELTGLKKGTLHYIIVRVVVGDTEVVGDDKIVEVKPEKDDEPPAFAGVRKATPSAGASVTLSWNAASDDLSPKEVISYLIYMTLAPGLGSDETKLITPFAVSRPGATSFEVRGLPAAETKYYFVVRARDAAGNVDDNTIEIAGTSGPDTKAPSFSGCNLATAKNASALDVFWDPAVDDVAAQDQIIYNLYASKLPEGHNFSAPSATFVGGTQGFVEGLEKSEKYYIICRAEDPSGNEEENSRLASATTKSDDQPPTFAGIQLIENLGANQLDVIWQSATDNQTQPENIVYQAYFATSAEGLDLEGAPQVTSLPGASAMTIPDLISNTKYFLVVLAKDEAGNLSVPATPLEVTTKVSLRNDIALPIFAGRCATSSCHSNTSQTGGLVLQTGFEYAELVGVPKETLWGPVDALRVSPGNADESILILRLELPDEDANKMPLSDDIVTTGEIATIRLWINQGAENN